MSRLFLTFETQTYATLADAERAYTAFRAAHLGDFDTSRIVAFWNALVRADKRAKGIRLEPLPRKLTTDGGWADMLARKEARRLARVRDDEFGAGAA